ncbi:MAG: carbon storage regulator [Geminicoccaceae bacterium]|nr:carbon storage regulator [Geminicoccaceae bacterium]
MLYLTRREGEAVVINDEIVVRVIELKGRQVRLGITFPPTASVLREELYLAIRAANEAACRSATVVLDGGSGTVAPQPPLVEGDRS